MQERRRNQSKQHSTTQLKDNNNKKNDNSSDKIDKNVIKKNHNAQGLEGNTLLLLYFCFVASALPTSRGVEDVVGGRDRPHNQLYKVQSMHKPT